MVKPLCRMQQEVGACCMGVQRMGVKEGVPAGGLPCSCQHGLLLLADGTHMPSSLLTAMPAHIIAAERLFTSLALLAGTVLADVLC